MDTAKLVRALNAGWSTLYVCGDTRMMYHRLHGTKPLSEIKI